MRCSTDVPHVSRAAEILKASRDLPPGRLFEYNKRTTSRVSALALALVASHFFAATSFRELFALSRSLKRHHIDAGPTESYVELRSRLRTHLRDHLQLHVMKTGFASDEMKADQLDRDLGL